MGAIWEADRAIWEVCVPYGSDVHWIGAIWEPSHAIWKEDGTMRELHMPLWEPHAPNRSCRHCMGVTWHNVGAACDI
jgi:hypothetical protein